MIKITIDGKDYTRLGERWIIRALDVLPLKAYLLLSWHYFEQQCIRVRKDGVTVIRIPFEANIQVTIYCFSDDLDLGYWRTKLREAIHAPHNIAQKQLSICQTVYSDLCAKVDRLKRSVQPDVTNTIELELQSVARQITDVNAQVNQKWTAALDRANHNYVAAMTSL